MDYRTLHSKTVVDLRRIAKEQGVKVPAGTNKALLVQMIVDHMAARAVQAQKAKAQETKEETVQVSMQDALVHGEGEGSADALPVPTQETPVTDNEEGDSGADAAPTPTQKEPVTDNEAPGPDEGDRNADAASAATQEVPVTAPGFGEGDGGSDAAPASEQEAPSSDEGASYANAAPAPTQEAPVTASDSDEGDSDADAVPSSTQEVPETAQSTGEGEGVADAAPASTQGAPVTETEASTGGTDAAAPQGGTTWGGYQRQMSTQQRMGARTQIAPGVGFRQQNRAQPGGARFPQNDNRGRGNRSFDTNAGFRRPANEQGGFRRNVPGGNQPPYRRNALDDASQQGSFRRNVSDDASQQGSFRRNTFDDAAQQRSFRRNPPEESFQQQTGYQRALTQEQQGTSQTVTSPLRTYQRTLTEEQFQQQTGYRRPLQVELEQMKSEASEQLPTFDERTISPTASEASASGEYGDGAGILEIHPDGYGFLRAENYLPGNRDVYISGAQIRRFNLRTGDYVEGKTRPQLAGDRSVGMIYVNSVNGQSPELARNRKPFDMLIPVYPDERLRMERPDVRDTSLRIIDMIVPIGKGQRGMIVSPPKAGKTTLLKKIANAITVNDPEVHLIVLLIDERPEEVTDMKRSISGEVVYSTFDEAPENHTRVSEMVLERAQRLVELGKDVVVLLDSITRLARAYNLVIPPTGRSLSGGLDPGALYRPKRFFGAARNIEKGGSLTIIATALVDTGSRMDDIIYEEFKGTGNMELHLDRSLSDRRVFPAIDMYRSSTRREELLMTKEELEGMYQMRRMLSRSNSQEATEQLISLIEKTRTNAEFFQKIKGWASAYEKEGFKM